MNDNVIIIRYAELYLKGKNRNFFEKLLIDNICKALKGLQCKTKFNRSRYEVFDYVDQAEIVERLKKVFGIHSISIAKKCSADINTICSVVKEYKLSGTFKVNTNRADKNYPLTSIEVSAKAGGAVLSANPKLTVDVHNPQSVINIDIREDGCAYIFKDKILCSGGMPVGSAGRGLLLLSGGLDSPVAAYMMAKRGLRLTAIHFHSYPYTSEKAKQKVIDLARILTDYTGPIDLICIPFTKIQEEI
ncbi:MAG: tRNA 4-thiouridine(8) synthase ThiI, partial [Clostridia bacterium]|nr:tRNA 4-thiouridine(8) synthase ThiI [Clostridia bacterium]